MVQETCSLDGPFFCCSISEGCREAVAALARYVLLKCPDKAELRSRAVECAIKLTSGLPQRERNDFVIFAARLSRTAKASNPYVHMSDASEREPQC